MFTHARRSLSLFFSVVFPVCCLKKIQTRIGKLSKKLFAKKREGKRVFRARANRKRTIYGRLECACVCFALCVSKKNKSITLLLAKSRRRFFKSEEKKRDIKISCCFLKSSPNLEKDKNLVCETVCEMVSIYKKRRHFQTPLKKS